MRDIWFCLAQLRMLVSSIILYLLLVAVIIVLTYATNEQTLLMTATLF